MKRTLAITIFTLVFLVLAFCPKPARALHHRPWACTNHWWQGKWHVKKLIECQSERSDIAFSTTLGIAKCENHSLKPKLDGGKSKAFSGIYMQKREFWSDRSKRYGFKGYSVYNARANIIVSIRMMVKEGLFHWAGCL